jgi:hemerythrin-like domain-containing protein
MDGLKKAGRRAFIRNAAVVGGGLVLVGRAAMGATTREDAETPKAAEGEEGVSPAEDLMREHGVLRRILLVYNEALRRIDAGDDLPAKPLADAAGIVRTFIEDYHEKLEEDFLFPRFWKAGRLRDLVGVLLEQHQGGRKLTEAAIGLANAETMSRADGRQALAAVLRPFIRMYGPHAAREDTVLFPAIREIVGADEYSDLGEQFEDKEHELFGAGGFEGVVVRVAAIEKSFGLYDLEQFTPKG